MRRNRLYRQWDRLDAATLKALQLKRLRSFLKREVLPNSAFYRDVFEREKIDPDQLRTFDDLRRIPFTTKEDLLNSREHPERARDFVLIPDQAALRRRPSVVAAALLRGKEHVQRKLGSIYRPVFLTSTTGRSAEAVPFLYSQYDIENLRSAGERLVWVLGAEPDSRILNSFPFAPHLAFWQTHYACATAGVFSLSSGGGKVMGTEGNIRLVQKLKPTSLIGMPTFIYHLLQQAVEEERSFPFLQHFVFGGEKVPAGMRNKLAELAAKLGAENVRMVATYGFTEAKVAWGQCPFPLDGEPSGYHLYPDLGFFEVVDPDSGEPLPDETPGELVYTCIDGRGSVVLRYRMGDCIEGGLFYGPCPHCGRMCPRLEGAISRRSQVKEMRLGKVKGTLIDFNELEHLLDDAPNIGAWQVEIRKLHDDPMELDELILHVVRAGGRDEEQLRHDLRETFKASLEIVPNEIFFHSAEAMRERHGVGTELKEKRVADHRAQEGEPPPPPRAQA